MKNFWEKYKGIVVVIVYMIVVFCIIYFGGLYLLENISNKRVEIEKKKADDEIRMRQVEDLPNLQSQLEEVKGNEAILNFLVDRDSALELIKKIEGVADNTGNIIDISIPERSSEKTKKEDDNKDTILGSRSSSEYIEMNINSKASYTNVYNFIYKLENLRYFSDIVSFSISEYEKKSSPQTNLLGRITEDQAEDEQQVEVVEENLVEAQIKILFYLEEE